LVLETRLAYIKSLPITLLWIRTTPWNDIDLSPYKILYGLPYLSSVTDVPTFETNYFLINYILGLSSTLLCLRKKGLLAQAPPLDFPIHPHQPGNYVLIKIWKENKLEQLGLNKLVPTDHGNNHLDCGEGVGSSHTGTKRCLHLTGRNNRACSCIQVTTV
jgi:hypothetical protein